MTSDSDLQRGSARFDPRPGNGSDLPGVADTTADRRVAFAREKFLWLDQVRADPELTPLAFMLAYVLADLVNEGEGYAWPSVAYLAAECRVTERGVQKVIRRLVECGRLSVELGNGRGETNRYRWIVGNDDARRAGDARNENRPSRCDGKAQHASFFSDRKERTPVHPIEAERVNHGSQKGEQPFQKGRTTVHPTLSNESIYDPIYRLSPRRSAQSPPIGFGDFWRAYPKKVARSAAMCAFARAVQQVTPDELIRGAICYAAERQGEDPRYTKHPATWLNKTCWNDTIPPPRVLLGDGLPESRRFDRSIAAQLHSDDDYNEVLTRIRQQRNTRG